MSLDSIIDLDISIKDASVSRAGFGMPLVLATSAPFSGEVRSYASVSAMADDGFATSDAAYLAAHAILSQSPRPSLIKVGSASGSPSSIFDALNDVESIDRDWYALILGAIPADDEDLVEAAAWVESRRKLLLATSADPDILASGPVAPANGADTATTLRDLGYHRTALVYHPSPETFPAAAWGGVMMPSDPGSASWKFKTLAGVAPIALTETQRGFLDRKCCNHYTRVAGVSIMREGYASSGRFLDVTRGIDWLHARMQEELFVVLTNAEKIPYTDGGVAIIENTIRGVLGMGVDAELLDEDSIGVSVPRVADVSSINRTDRVLPNVSFSARLAGAIHKVQINGTVSV